MRAFEDNSLSIGNTPLVSLGRVARGMKAKVFGKVEGRNPSYSVKCRIGAAMVWDAEERGILKPGGTIVEPTSGNTGIALAFVAAARGYRLIITMPESFSDERVKLLEVFGAEVIRTPVDDWMPGSIQRAEEIAAENPDYFMPQQFKNPANPAIHFKTTGPEIWEDTEGEIDVLVSGVGTGGTITGVSRYIKQERGKAIVSVAVEPAKSAVLSGGPIGPHGIQGIGAGFIPEALDLTIIDRIVQVEDEEAFDYTRRLAREEGIICGMSSGAALAAAMRLANEDQYEGKNIVVILPDSGERYLSTPLFD
ncbi:MAG: cysteine synthase A [Candidatus Hydrogenedentes bacterium]|nr:cysteine synthase A [Candidatus Hydrogenedentota bacterium]